MINKLSAVSDWPRIAFQCVATGLAFVALASLTPSICSPALAQADAVKGTLDLDHAIAAAKTRSVTEIRNVVSATTKPGAFTAGNYKISGTIKSTHEESIQGFGGLSRRVQHIVLGVNATEQPNPTTIDCIFETGDFPSELVGSLLHERVTLFGNCHFESANNRTIVLGCNLVNHAGKRIVPSGFDDIMAYLDEQSGDDFHDAILRVEATTQRSHRPDNVK